MTAPTNSDAETTPSRAVVVSDACSAAFAEEMRKRSLATGHGDTLDDLHREMWWQFDEVMKMISDLQNGDRVIVSKTLKHARAMYLVAFRVLQELESIEQNDKAEQP